MKKLNYLLVKVIISAACVLYVSVSQVFAQENKTLDSLYNKLQEVQDDTTKVKIYIHLSEHFIYVDILKAEDYLNKAYNLVHEKDIDKFKGSVIYNLGNTYILKGQYQLALKYLLEFLEIQENNKNQRNIAIAYAGIASVYYSQENLDEALLYNQKSLEYYNEFYAPIDVSNKNRIINNIANIYEDKKEYSKALETYRLSYKSSIISNDNINLGNVCNNIGNLFLELEVYDSAFHYLHKGLKIRKNNDDISGITKSNKNIGVYYIKINDYNKAISILHEAQIAAAKIGELSTIIDINEQLSIAYENTNQFENALVYHKLVENAKDSLFNVTMTRELTKLEMQFEYEKREEKLKFEQQKKELQFYITIAILLLVLIIIGLLYHLGRSRVKRIKLEQKTLIIEKESLEQRIELRNKELATNVMYLVKKNEFLNTITSKMLDLKENLKAENQEALQKLIYDIQRSIDTEVWQEFEIRFQRVHNEFYKNLNKKFPDLSPNEKKLCAFLRLNMSTKEIASMLHRNEKSVSVARARLRKKMNLTNTDIDLINFLSSI